MRRHISRRKAAGTAGIFAGRALAAALAAALLGAALLLSACDMSKSDEKDDDDDGNGAVTYTLVYDGNGATAGTIPAPGKNYAPGTKVTVLGNDENLVKTGFAYSGWNSKADGGGVTYTQGQTLVMPAAHATLYAKWTANPTYKVTYNPNGASGGSVPVDSTNYEAGQTVTVLGNTGSLQKINVTDASYKFAGWNTQSDGNGTDYAAGSAAFEIAESTTLYAKWTPYVLLDTGPGGGLIFYDQGTYSGGWRYLEAAPESTEWTEKEWGSYETAIGGTDTALGTGLSNTTAIVSWLDANTDDFYLDVTLKAERAAYLCACLESGGCGDWFLPSRDEAAQMYLKLKTADVGGFSDFWYWSSSENNDLYSWYYDFGTNEQDFYYKYSTTFLFVRAARRF